MQYSAWVGEFLGDFIQCAAAFPDAEVGAYCSVCTSVIAVPTMSRRLRTILVAVLVAGATVTVVPANAAPLDPCAPWTMETVAAGLDEPENLEADGDGGFYVSGASSIVHVDANGTVVPLLDNLPAPRGLQLHDDVLHFVTGQDSKLRSFDVRTRELDDVAEFPAHGLLRLPNGDFLTTDVGTDIGAPSRGLTRYEPDTGAVLTNWSPVPRSEGLALSPDHTRVYTDDLFTGQVIEVPLESPDQWSVVATIPGIPGLDDLTMSSAGTLYVAAHFEGAIHRVDPMTGNACVIASGLSGGWTGPSSVRIGPAAAGYALYVTVFDGTLRRLTPPEGVELTPVGR
ncbi:SMP-30/gluconolactonase/LRE family protein [Rhodococcus sp. G-MC3]|uniref:SMP-30/gluconolactonase/LRE family protein n=1 Tax=Rhodococcus sp. G-MC3 TaxID=3046209 RepID=UPI0024BA6209|nr:SMP-30/gluconolactonase/LRE family protein [Rhodococcus sp. G-MC3]MDJ0396740.1 SMP-30/gluconolactonase/LRE family protein [Rhodococcus sp. G-MC3]